MEYIGTIAKQMGVSRSWAHRMAKRYKWPYTTDANGYRLYDPEVAVRLTPDQAKRRRQANAVRRAKALLRTRHLR